jgi:hypothetical protein
LSRRTLGQPNEPNRRDDDQKARRLQPTVPPAIRSGEMLGILEKRLLVMSQW